MRRSLLALVAPLSLLAAPARSYADDIGVRVLDQKNWTPYTDDETVYTVVDDPTLITRALHDRWPWTRYQLDLPLRDVLSVDDQLADGVSLHEVWLDIAEPVSTLAPGATDGVFVVATDLFDDIRVHSSDPGCVLSFDLTATWQGALQNDAFAPISGLSGGLAVSDFRAEGDSPACAAIAADAWALDARLTSLVTDPASTDATLIGDAVLQHLGVGIGTANLAVAAVSTDGARPGWGPDLPGVVGWAETGLLTFAFDEGVRFPDDGLRNGVVSGRFTSPASTTTCDALPVELARKTGPRPIVSPAGDLGAMPVEPLPLALTCATDETTTFALWGLPDNFPTLTFTGSRTGCPAESAEYTDTFVVVSGIEPRILPSEQAWQRDVTADQ